MLSDKEFSHMAVLGRESMVRAVNEHFDWLFKDFSFAPARPVDGAEATQSAPRITAVDEDLADSEPAPLEEAVMSEPVFEAATMEEELPGDEIVEDTMLEESLQDTADVAASAVSSPSRVYLQVAPRPRDTPTAAQGTGGLISVSEAEHA
jgi:hypothetical protein